MPTLRLLPEFEAALRQVQGVRAASVVTGPDSRPTEIHILAMPGKAAKQVVRDVQSLAMAQFDLDIDHRIVSVVQLGDEELGLGTPPVAETTVTVDLADEVDDSDGEDPEDEPVIDVTAPERIPAAFGLSVVPPAVSTTSSMGQPTGQHRAQPTGPGTGSDPAAAAAARLVVLPDTVAAAQAEDEGGPRPAITAIMVRTSGQESEATVALAAGGHLFEGRVVGPSGPAHRPRLVAQATMHALEDLLGQNAEVETATITGVGSRSVALVVLTVMQPRIGEQIITGSALVRGDDADAVARAVLNALNRRLSG